MAIHGPMVSPARLARFRMVLLGAVGASLACGPAIDAGGQGGETEGMSGGSSGGQSASDGGSGASATAAGSDGSGGGTSGGTTSDGSGASASASGGSDGSTGEVPPVPVPDGVCAGAVPIMQPSPHDDPTGFVRCPDGSIERAEAVSCVDPMPAGKACPGEGGGTCVTDDDCVDGAHGRCVTQELGGGLPGAYCGCTYGCASDADCNDGFICACAGVEEVGYPTGSTCVPSNCADNGDCGTLACAMGWSDDGCGPYYAVACQTESDTCRSDADCEGDWVTCTPSVTGWACSGGGACGRPLMVDGRAVTAVLVSGREAEGRGWIDASVRPSLQALSAPSRRALARHWSRVGLLEHASVASFARFCRQLMAVGAPADLLMEAIAAMADETDHARRCFALASAYEGEAVGPGHLEAPADDEPWDLASVVAALVEEACVAETIAAIEAEHAAGLARDPAVRETLQKIAADELRHAKLGWRTLSWALSEASDEVQRAAERALRRAIAMADAESLRATEGGDEGQLRDHGVLAPVERRALTLQALQDVVEPCWRTVRGQEREHARARA